MVALKQNGLFSKVVYLYICVFVYLCINGKKVLNLTKIEIIEYVKIIIFTICNTNLHSPILKMAQQHTIGNVAKRATETSHRLSKGYKPLHIVTRQNCFVNYLNDVLLQYPPHTLVTDIELSNATCTPCVKKPTIENN